MIDGCNYVIEQKMSCGSNMGLQGTKRVVNHRFIHIALQFFGLTLRDKSPLTDETGMCNSSLCREIKTTSDKID